MSGYQQPWHPQMPPPVPPPKRSISGWVWFLVAALVGLLGLAGLVIAGFVFGVFQPPRSGVGLAGFSTTSVPPDPPRPVVRTLFDQTTAARDDRYLYWQFTFRDSQRIDISVERVAGDNHFRTYLLTNEEFDRLREVDGALFGGDFRHYPDFHVANGTELNAGGTLPPGQYVFVVQEASNQNLLRSADRVHVHARGTTTVYE